MKPIVQLLYEYGIDGKPHGSGVIRLLRPFSYPTIVDRVDSRMAWSYNRYLSAKIAIVDRFWHPHDVTFEQVESMVKEVRESGCQLIYAIDDNLLDLPRERFSFQDFHFQIVDFLLKNANGILVTTPFLAERFSIYHKPTYILKNALDDRLLLPRRKPGISQNSIIKIGYMGTVTHKGDLEMILPALKSVAKRHPNVRYEFIGGVAKTGTLLSDLPISWISPDPDQDAYSLFMLWFTGRVHWDIAIAPLEDTDFNRAKSDIKLLDYAAVGAAGIFSNVRAYQNTVIHGKTGWLAESSNESWEEALETLISDHEMRQAIADEAHQYLRQQRILKVCAPQWLDALNSFGRVLF